MTLEQESTIEHQRRVEKAFDPSNFDELLAMAQEVCLAEPVLPNFQTPVLSVEQSLIAKVGIAGIRAALDFKYGSEFQGPLPADADDDSNDLWMRPDVLIREPRLFAEGFNYDRAARTEAFGSQLMSESWRTLGPEAQEMADAFKAATCDEQQHAVLDWLDKRLVQMAEHNESKSKSQIYHPIRLSPKAIGTYPELNVAPTCLSVSIIAAGFLREAGANVLHGSVAVTGQEKLLWDLAVHNVDMARQAREIHGVEMPDMLEQRLRDRARLLMARYIHNEGVHASLLVRHQSGKWSQFDSNYGVSCSLPRVGGKDRNIDAVYDELMALHSVAPGMEFFIDSGMPTIMQFVQEVYQGNSEYVVSRDEIRDLLRSEDIDAALDRLQEIVVEQFFNYQTDNKHLEVIQRLLRQVAIVGPEEGSTLLDVAYENAVVSWLIGKEDTPEAVFERCRRDPYYLERKVDDAQMLGLLTAQLFGGEIFNEKPRTLEGGSVHSLLEVGLPEAKIGNAVLCEFARHCGETLSAHHWLAQWPSVLSASEKSSLAHNSEAQDKALQDAAEVFATKKFTYSMDYGKTRMSLNKRHESGVDGEE